MKYCGEKTRARSRRTLVIVIVTVALMNLFLLATPLSAADWRDSMGITYSPGSLYALEPFDLEFNISISAVSGSTYVHITSFFINYDWNPRTTQLCPSNVNISNLPSYHLFHWTGTLPLTATLGVHSLSAQVDGVAEGEDFTSMSVWTGDITIVLRPSLTAAISADHVSGKFPLDVIFTSAVSGGKPSYTYSWIFGDGGTSTLANPTHTFATSGDFTVSLNVTDQLGHTVSSEELQITVSSPSTLPIILLIGALGAVIVAIVVVVVVMKSKKKESQPPAQPPIDSS